MDKKKSRLKIRPLAVPAPEKIQEIIDYIAAKVQEASMSSCPDMLINRVRMIRYKRLFGGIKENE